MPPRRSARLNGFGPEAGYPRNDNKYSNPKARGDSFSPELTGAVIKADSRSSGWVVPTLNQALERTFGEPSSDRMSSPSTGTHDKDKVYHPNEIGSLSSDQGKRAVGSSAMTPNGNFSRGNRQSSPKNLDRRRGSIGIPESTHPDAQRESADLLQDLRDIQGVLMSIKKMVRYTALPGIHRLQFDLEKRMD